MFFIFLFQPFFICGSDQRVSDYGMGFSARTREYAPLEIMRDLDPQKGLLDFLREELCKSPSDAEFLQKISRIIFCFDSLARKMEEFSCMEVYAAEPGCCCPCWQNFCGWLKREKAIGDFEGLSLLMSARRRSFRMQLGVTGNKTKLYSDIASEVIRDLGLLTLCQSNVAAVSEELALHLGEQAGGNRILSRFVVFFGGTITFLED